MAERYQDRSFQGDDRYGRGRDAAPESDPLAELARLIGQTDPFSGQQRQQPNMAPPPAADSYRAPPQPTVPPQPSYEDEQPPMPSWLRHRSRDTGFRAHEPEAPAMQAPAAPEPYRAPQVYQPESYQPQSYQPDTYQPDTYQQGGYQQSGYQADPYQADPYQASSYRQEPSFPGQAAAQPAAPADFSRYDDALYGQMPSQGYVDPLQETAAYSDPSYNFGNGYDEPEQKPRRGGMLTVAAVIALAVVGTGGAFAYRTFMGSPRSGEPPIIKAEPGPTKVVPPSAAEAGKPIQDRLASGGSNTEMLISREEQPQDPSKYGSRVVLPPLTQNNNPPTPASVAPANKPLAAVPSSASASGEEPRKIKTVPVRPDQADAAAGRPAQRAAAAAPAAPSPNATRTPPPPVANANASTGAPLSLAPQPGSRVAATAPTAQPEVAGGYVVQVSSQRSAADAQASFRALQNKYPSVLGSRTPLIKRADLGDKGVYYRAMIGPFGSSDDAARFCGSLRSAGGQCVVQRN
ncbi:sporulation related protein [Rhodopseudomonas faecalis]|uniref:Sporulation related protein n=1 Tax=Rhodopseudomonas faecalis TaxID=99655 RepID=A0A318TR64_9BRAD|nr:SPOR domain-containing protein [Rhodopseudomonas faecalis]PYF05528.1 sporulation related protein [Rhodopseudomonas faecalis]